MSFLYVKVFYGPCDTFQAKSHKPQLLYGLRDHLQMLGFRVDLVPVPFDNYCMIEMCGHEVFRCNIRNFKFNTEFSRDIVCQRAVGAVLQSSIKFRRARASLWFGALLDHQMFKRSKWAPKDYWIPKTHEFDDKGTCDLLESMEIKMEREEATTANKDQDISVKDFF